MNIASFLPFKTIINIDKTCLIYCRSMFYLSIIPYILLLEALVFFRRLVVSQAEGYNHLAYWPHAAPTLFQKTLSSFYSIIK